MVEKKVRKGIWESISSIRDKKQNIKQLSNVIQITRENFTFHSAVADITVYSTVCLHHFNDRSKIIRTAQFSHREIWKGSGVFILTLVLLYTQLCSLLVLL